MKYVMATVLALSLVGCAVEEYPDERKLDPISSARDRVAIAAQYLQKGENEQAQRHLNRALELDPKSAEAHNILAVLLEKEGDKKSAEKHFRKAVELRPDYSQARNNYGAFLYKKGDYAGSVVQYEKVVTDLGYDKRDLAFEGLGRASLKTGNKDRAESAFTRALRINPDLPMASLELAALLADKGSAPEARKYYQHYQSLTEGQVQNARGLWLGIRLERVFGDKNALASYELALKKLYPTSEEYKAYQESLKQGK